MCNDKSAPMPSCFYHFGTFSVPADTGDPWKDPSQKCLAAHMTGRGEVRALCYRANYYGIWFGYEIDDYPLVVAHNGHCLQNMGLIGNAANGMPYYLPYFNSPEDLSIACREPLRFDKSFKLWIGNSHPAENKQCIGLHIYVSGHGIEPAPGNLCDWDVVWRSAGGRHPNTRISSEVIQLERALS